jgi:hypothetical protein
VASVAMARMSAVTVVNLGGFDIGPNGSSQGSDRAYDGIMMMMMD